MRCSRVSALRAGTLVVASTLLAGLWALPTPAQARPAAVLLSEAAPERPKLWMEAMIGLAPVDSVIVEGIDFDHRMSFAPTFRLSVHYRVWRFDFGGVIEALAGGNFIGLRQEFQVGGQFRAALSARWRFVDAQWGAFSVNIDPGYALFANSDALRFRVGEPSDLELDQVDATVHAFSMGLGVGAIFYTGQDFGVTVHIDTLISSGGFDRPEATNITRVRLMLGAGITWGL